MSGVVDLLVLPGRGDRCSIQVDLSADYCLRGEVVGLEVGQMWLVQICSLESCKGLLISPGAILRQITLSPEFLERASHCGIARWLLCKTQRKLLRADITEQGRAMIQRHLHQKQLGQIYPKVRVLLIGLSRADTNLGTLSTDAVELILRFLREISSCLDLLRD